MKRCCGCKENLSLTQFHKRGTKHQFLCKACRKKYDAAYWQRNKKRLTPRKYAARNLFRDWLREQKEGKPCTDCGGSFHFAAMQWDHLP